MELASRFRGVAIDMLVQLVAYSGVAIGTVTIETVLAYSDSKPFLR